MATKADLRNAVLEELQVRVAEEAVSAEDAAKAERHIDRVAERLAVRGYLIDTSAITDDLMDPLTVLVASSAARSFEVDLQAVIALKAEAVGAEAEIRRLLASSLGAEPVEANYY